MAATLVLAALLVLVGAMGGSAREATPAPLRLKSPPAAVQDGDTFDVDLNGNGRVELPGERVRLLYVDTPELHESRKGLDLKHGLPARDFLNAALQAQPVVLHPPPGAQFGRHGRRLAVVIAGGRNVNLELIRLGHSYFDTRFGFPADYDRYAAAEAEAFAARRGIWAQAASRKRYLKRLRSEGKTPRSTANRLYLPKPQAAGHPNPRTWVGRYVRLRGTLLSHQRLSKGAHKLLLHLAGVKEPLPVFVPGWTAWKFPLEAWPPKAPLEMEGFVKLYRKAPELVLHFGRRVRKGR